jgi:DNA-binding GntR family transcriptional regulator|tara:strand:+ start:130 stop:252 length:123 start_codon:yes stop_codon:yes gene_type:complete
VQFLKGGLAIAQWPLVEEFGVSQGTIRRALDDLVLQGSLV